MKTESASKTIQRDAESVVPPHTHTHTLLSVCNSFIYCMFFIFFIFSPQSNNSKSPNSAISKSSWRMHLLIWIHGGTVGATWVLTVVGYSHQNPFQRRYCTDRLFGITQHCLLVMLGNCAHVNQWNDWNSITSSWHVQVVCSSLMFGSFFQQFSQCFIIYSDDLYLIIRIIYKCRK